LGEIAELGPRKMHMIFPNMDGRNPHGWTDAEVHEQKVKNTMVCHALKLKFSSLIWSPRDPDNTDVLAGVGEKILLRHRIVDPDED